MTDITKSYLYMGVEEGYEQGYLYYYDASTNTWKSGVKYGEKLPELTDDIKFALLDCFKNIAWAVDNGTQFYNTLYNALITIYFLQDGNMLTMYGVRTIDSVTQNGTELVLS